MRNDRTAEDRRQALAWIARQLRWERILAELRAGRSVSIDASRAA
jgi:hypothetical protein